MAASGGNWSQIIIILMIIWVIIVISADSGTSQTTPEKNERNVAQFAHSTQSSLSGSLNPSSLAVDDSITTCSRTGDERGANWTVDVGQTYIISEIRVNTGGAFFGQNFELYIGKDLESPGMLCGYGPTSDTKKDYNISCFSGAMSGRTVTIKNKFSGGVRLCDVQIMVCEDGYFGVGCVNRCHCDENKICSKDVGACPGLCAPGWNGESCQEECMIGSFGTGCQRSCHCMYNVGCDVLSGECSTGCAESWIGPACQTAIPKMKNPPMLRNARTTDISIRWPSWSEFVDRSLALLYQVEYKLNDFHGNSSWMEGPLVEDTDDLYQQALVTNLLRNSFYEFKVTPIIKIGNQEVKGGVSPKSSTFRTKCHAPDTPNITSIYSWVDGSNPYQPQAAITVDWMTNFKIVFSKPLTKQQSNCDSIQYYEVLYQRQGQTEWLNELALQSASSKNVTGLDFSTEYYVIVIAHNNQPLDSSSARKQIVTVVEPESLVSFKQTSMDMGVIVGVIVCVALLVAVILVLIIYRRQMAKYNSVPTQEPDGKALLNNMVKSLNKNYSQTDSGILEGSADVSPISLVNQEPPMLHPRLTENGRINKLKELAPIVPVERFPIKVEDLEEYVITLQPNDNEELRKEYKEIPDTNREACLSAGERLENRLKNRFINILPYDHSRVILDKVEGDVDSDYINASYINGYQKPRAYIASQGCNKWTIQDMWRMVWQVDSYRIVMVTNLVEKGKTKCEQYWPDNENEEKMYGDIAVTLTDVERTADFVIRTFELRKEQEIRHVKQFHYTTWPDHGVPTRAGPIIAFRRKVRSYDESHPGLILVHCSAGVGRTGAFIALDYLLDQAKTENIIDVYGFACSMRRDRVNMIQTVEQYIFVYDALLEALKVGNTVISCTDFMSQYDGLCQVDPEKEKSLLQEQFEMLQRMSPRDKPEDYSLGSQPENKEKNRNPEILPADRHRPYLMTRVQGTNDYINAVFLDGYRNRNAYIITQMPLPHTVIDLWRMVYEHKCGTIVMLNTWNDEDESYGQYWPEENEECECGPFIIEAVSIDRQNPDITVRELKLSYHPQSPSLKNQKKDETPRTVNQFQFNCWPIESAVASSKLALMSLLDMVERSQYKTGNHPIVIHCHDGVRQSGLYASVSCIWERMKDEQEVDVFQAVKHLRYHRPSIILDMEQYQFCYEMILTYLTEFSIYSNFR